jgi:hypothetical protein
MPRGVVNIFSFFTVFAGLLSHSADRLCTGFASSGSATLGPWYGASLKIHLL